ncbi:hypothetical protein GJ496_003928 [Pomphorhynchus laevis]|nr:hypothetical protein GJ496_003928 [Pomphorhynchus laevis]
MDKLLHSEFHSKLKIRNSSKLEQFAAKYYKPTPDELPTPVIPPKSSFFDEMHIINNIDRSDPKDLTIMVQPDTRFLIEYCLYHITRAYPEYNIKGSPLISTLSLLA